MVKVAKGKGQTRRQKRRYRKILANVVARPLDGLSANCWTKCGSVSGEWRVLGWDGMQRTLRDLLGQLSRSLSHNDVEEAK